MKMKKNIAICEFECKSFQHEEVNAAVIKLVLDSHSQTNVYLFCDNSHFKHIKHIYESRTGNKLNVKHVDIRPPIGEKFEHLRYHLTIKKFFSRCKDLGIEKIYVTNTHYNALLAFNRFIGQYPKIKIKMIVHGQLEEHFKYSAYKKILLYYFWLIRIIEKSSPQISFYVVSDHIKLALQETNIKRKFHSINHPYLWNTKITRATQTRNKIKLCCIGSVHRDKGKTNLRRIIRDLSQTSAEFELAILGNFKCNTKDSRIILHNRRFTRDEFDQLIPNYDFILAPYDSGSYHLKASGILFDAINYNIPIITTKTPFTDFYFKLLGDIGYMANNYKELIECILNRINYPNPEQTKKMKECIYQAKILSNSNFIS